MILSTAGLIVECGFAYGWSRRGSYDLAGKQRVTVDKIFNRASYVMIGDLSLSVAEIAFGVGGIATYWIGLVQPIMAVHIVKLFYRLKGEHPEYLAEMEIVDMQANMKTSLIRDAAQDQRLQLAEKSHERSLEWAALHKRHEHGTKLVGSRWYDRQVKRCALCFNLIIAPTHIHLVTGLNLTEYCSFQCQRLFDSSFSLVRPPTI